MTLHTGNRTTTKSYYKRSIALYTVCCSNLPTFSSTGRRTSAVLMSLQVWEGRGTYGGTKRGRDHHLWRLLLNLALESGSASIRDRLCGVYVLSSYSSLDEQVCEMPWRREGCFFYLLVSSCCSMLTCCPCYWDNGALCLKVRQWEGHVWPGFDGGVISSLGMCS